MAQVWTKPDPSVPRSRIDTAGNTLIYRLTGPRMADRDEALAIISNWRAAHGWPLNAIKLTLRKRALRVDKDALVAQRLKRLSSIDAKLRREPNMKLSQMQDIGGCRAVISTIRKAERLVAMAEDRATERSVGELIKKSDYLAYPKVDGYRGVHLIYRYRSDRCPAWNGLRVEVQVRTKVQHTWATALETVATFTGQQLKAGGGEAEWKRFFALMSSAFAVMEDRPIVPGTSDDPDVLVPEIRDLADSLHVARLLEGWQETVQFIGERRLSNIRLYLIVLDSEARTVTITSFTNRQQAMASRRYLSAEEQVEKNPNLNAVLASAESVKALKDAFPNYYLDTSTFRKALDALLNPQPARTKGKPAKT